MSIIIPNVYCSLSVNSTKCTSLDLQVGRKTRRNYETFCSLSRALSWKMGKKSLQTTDSSTQMALRENGTSVGKRHLQIWEQFYSQKQRNLAWCYVKSPEYCNFTTNWRTSNKQCFIVMHWKMKLYIMSYSLSILGVLDKPKLTH